MSVTADQSHATARVAAFVAAVERHLLDLDPDTRRGLVEGLEADLVDRLVEQVGGRAGLRGDEPLGDPAAYAAELRAAAGLPPTPAAPLPTTGPVALRRVRDAAVEALDAVHTGWDRLLDSLPGDARGFVSAFQPAWWVLRGVTAWLVLQDVRRPSVVVNPGWLAVLVVCVVGSVWLGRRRGRVGRRVRASLLARLVLVGLNVFAVSMVPGAADRVAWRIAEVRGAVFAPSPSTDLVYRGTGVCDLQVRDRDGRLVHGAVVRDVDSDRTIPLHPGGRC